MCTRQSEGRAGRKVKALFAESILLRVSMDYCFLTEDVDRSSGDHGEAEVQRAGFSITVAVMQESLCKSVWAYAVDTSTGDRGPGDCGFEERAFGAQVRPGEVDS